MPVSFTPKTALQAMGDACCALTEAHFIKVASSPAGQTSFLPIPVIHAFCQTVCDALAARPHTLIVVCPHNDSASSLSNAILLYGAYLLLCKAEPLNIVVDELQDSIAAFGCMDLCIELDDASIMDAWSALDRAKALNWLAAPDCANAPALEIDMAAHYAFPANGSLHMLVPDRLLSFPSPAPLPAGQAWADACAGCGEPG